MTRTLRSGFLASAERVGASTALAVGDARLSYRELARRASAVAATLDRHAAPGEGKLTAVFGHRHPTAFVGILGALLRGHGYVPLNPAFPPERTASMLARSRCRSIVVDPTALDALPHVLEAAPEGCVVVLPDVVDAASLASRSPRHTFLGAADLASGEGYVPRAAGPQDLAYLLFTSGSTGQPKGVMITHANVRAFLDAAVARYGITEHDRLSSTFDLTFDLSVFDLFCAWERGACVCVPTAAEKMFPRRYIESQELSVFFCVPSMEYAMHRLKMLEPGAYPTLRCVLFCGEALPREVVERFRSAAPNAVIENLYGPTELTIACALYRWDPERSPGECERGVVPIGAPYEGMIARVVGADLREVPRGEPGELVMAGPQTSPGYWNDPEKTATSFVRVEGDDRTFYRTGDRVRWPENGPMVYLGRDDGQIKIQGYRVELGEVEAVLRDVSGAVAVAVGFPRTASGADGIVAFVGAPDGDPDAILARARARLPAYMRPSEVRLIAELPLNANGKIDRGALVAALESRPGER